MAHWLKHVYATHKPAAGRVSGVRINISSRSSSSAVAVVVVSPRSIEDRLLPTKTIRCRRHRYRSFDYYNERIHATMRYGSYAHRDEQEVQLPRHHIPHPPKLNQTETPRQPRQSRQLSCQPILSRATPPYQPLAFFELPITSEQCPSPILELCSPQHQEWTSWEQSWSAPSRP